MDYTIHGMQHLGVGVVEHEPAWKWYRKFFGLNMPFFNAEADAELMKIYTNNRVISKRAAMVLNLKGGCAIEVVCPSTFKAKHADVEFQLGDLGVNIGWVKTPDVQKAHASFKENGAEVISDIQKMPNGWETFYLKDPQGLIFQVIESTDFYMRSKKVTGGIMGCTVGVSDMVKSMNFYSVLGYDEVIYDQTDTFGDWSVLSGGNGNYRRTLLCQSNPSGGGFSNLLGKCYIELIQDLSDRVPVKIYEGRQWGDIGFVHLAFDVRNMKGLGKKLEEVGHGFTCDTNDALSMGDSTKVHCTYAEDPDGTLIEFIEVYKIPIIEKLGIYMNVEHRPPSQPYPAYLLKAMRFMQVKD